MNSKIDVSNKRLATLAYEAAEISGGTTDRILRVDLDENQISIMQLAPDFKELYTGGRGYALKLIWDETTAETGFDSPENLLVMAGGPLCNEPRFPGSGKFVVGTISPLTGSFMDSNVGGYFAPILKACGFDALAVKGIAKTPVILVVNDDKNEIYLQEAPSFDEQTDRGGISYGESLLDWFTGGSLHRNVAAVTTGIGAETTGFGLINSLFFDAGRKRLRTKQAGRGGTGTVMRYKNLFGVIVNSDKSRERKNNAVSAEKVKTAGSTLAKLIKAEDPKQLHLASWGTPVLSEYMNRFHLLPINNFQRGQDEGARAIFSDIFLEKYLDKGRADGCYFGCNLACAKGATDFQLNTGPFRGETVHVDGPEYETVGAVTALGIFDPHYIMEFNWYCDEYGIDTISAGVSSAFLFECFQRGYLTEEEAGYPLRWGSIEDASRLLHETGRGEGLGKICGMGIAKSKIWVAENHARRTGEDTDKIIQELNLFAMETKGLEFSMYISRESLAQQGGYGFALKGPQHDEAWLIFLDQVHREMESFEMKTAALTWFPLIRTWFNAVGLCKLPWIDVRHPEAAGTDNPAQNMPSFKLYVDYLNGTMGTEKSVKDILFDSERLHVLQKMINLRQGRGTRDADTIPLRAMAPAFLDEFLHREDYYREWLKENLEDGESVPESAEECHSMLLQKRRAAYVTLCDTVYSAKGYNSDAVPLRGTLEKFGLLDEKADKLLGKFGE